MATIILASHQLNPEGFYLMNEIPSQLHQKSIVHITASFKTQSTSTLRLADFFPTNKVDLVIKAIPYEISTYLLGTDLVGKCIVGEKEEIGQGGAQIVSWAKFVTKE